MKFEAEGREFEIFVRSLKQFIQTVNRSVSEGGPIAPPLFGRIEGAASSGATLHYYLHYYLPPHFYEATYAPGERSEQFLVTECFFNLFLEVSYVS